MLIHRIQRESLREILGMEEIFRSEAICSLVETTAGDQSIIFKMKAEILQVAVLPEIDSALYLEIATIGRAAVLESLEVLVSGVVVVIDEEEGITELVTLEHLEGGGHVLTILTEIVKRLDISLGLGHEREGQSGDSGRDDAFC